MEKTFFETIAKKHKIRSSELSDYLSVKDGFLYYEDLKLMDLVKKYGESLEVAYLPMIAKRINFIQSVFKDEIKKQKYSGKFIYAYASKANYYEEVIRTALDAGSHIETTTAYDMDIVHLMHQFQILPQNRLIICNGFKFDHYADKILELREKGVRNICPILENFSEIDLFNKSRQTLKVGVRLRVDISSSRSFKTKVENRFGFTSEEVDRACEKISDSSKLDLKILHSHFVTQIENPAAYINTVALIAEKYCRLKKKYKSLEYIDLGGGFPVGYSLDFHFDYRKLVASIISTIKQVCKKHSVSEPNIIGEFGRYTVSDHGFYIYKIILEKTSTQKDTSWYLINGSLMNSLPDAWALNQKFIVLPLNNWNLPSKNVHLGGITCDSDDVYFENEKTKTLELPEKGDELYIAFFSIGAYQEMISGVGGVHHCLMPEAKELIINKKYNGDYRYHVIHKRQGTERVLTLLDYHRYLSKLRLNMSHDFKEKFSPIKYLNEYYSVIGEENDCLLKFFEKAYSKIKLKNGKLLEIGGGPTIYQLISAAEKVESIDFAEYNKYNREEVEKWVRRDSDAFSWDEYFRHVLKIREKEASSEVIATLTNNLRKKIKTVIECDIFKSNPVGEKGKKKYDVVSVNFCPESCTDDEDQYMHSLRNISSVLKKDGTLVMTALKGAKSYKVFDMHFPAYSLNELKLKKALSPYFYNIKIESIPAEDPTHKYEGMMFVTASNL